MSSAKPMSSISSASSSTRRRTASRVERLRAAGDRARGPAWRRRCRRRARARGSAAASTRRRRAARPTSPVPRAYLWTASATCIASSRVGTSTRPRVRRGGPGLAASCARRWIIGSANAAVLPVPVAACASRSRARQHERNRPPLDRRRLLVAEAGDRLDEGLGQAERIKPCRRRGLRGGRHPAIVSFSAGRLPLDVPTCLPTPTSIRRASRP